jgi:protein-tyrosine kinase
MSRIDDALSRAKNFKAEDRPLAEDLPGVADLAGSGTLFASEPDAEGSDLAESDQPRSTPEPAPEPNRPAESAGDVHALPHVEKFATSSANATSTEQYRRLAGRLYLAQAEHGTRVVMITSAMPGEGKTLTATNLAVTLSESYKRQVLLIDADLRRPWIHEMFRLPNLTGLNDSLRNDEERKIPLLRLTDHLSVLTAGRPDPDPMAVLSSERMQRVLHEASARFDWVIIDTPPVALLTDAHLLAAVVDAVVLVIQAGQTPLPAINTAIQAVGRDRIIGVVLNRVDDALVYHAYQYYDTYHTEVVAGNGNK